MLDTYWLEQAQENVSAGDDWLSPAEVLHQSRLRVAKRRADWRLGRWTAKRAVTACLEMSHQFVPFEAVSILPAGDGAPEVVCAGMSTEITISLSHRAGSAICVVALSGAALGCDLEIVEPRDAAFLADYFTSAEHRLIARAPEEDRTRLVTLLWSAKESAMKALHVGLRVDTTSLTVDLVEGPGSRAHGDWHPLEVRYCRERVFQGWWQHTSDVVRTLVADPPPDPPIRLNIADECRSRRWSTPIQR